MAPRTKAPLKSYSRNTCGNRSKLDILHSILTDPIKKKSRRKPKLEVKELPPRTQQICALNTSDSSLITDKNINTDNTFDRLLNKTNYNKVTFKVVVQNNSSDSSLSTLQKSKQCSPLQLQITKKRSPAKRKRIRSVRKRSPIVTRSVSFQNLLSNSNKTNDDKKVRTLDRTVDESLYIEREGINKRCNESLNLTTKDNSLINSFEPIFSKSFTEKYNNLNIPVVESSAISSTPVMPVFKQRLINETIISPIVNLEDDNVESNTTPKSKRVSRVRKSKLISDNGDLQILPLRQDVECSRNISSDILNQDVTANPKTQIALKDPKLQRNAIVNITLLNSKNLVMPFVNLTSIDLNSINELNLRNVIEEINRSKVSAVNITTRSFDNYLNKSSIIDDDLYRVQSPVVNITRIDLNKFLGQRSVCSESVSDESNESYHSELNSDNKIDLNDSSNSGFRGFPPDDSCLQLKDETSIDLDESVQIYLTLRRRKVPRSKPVGNSVNKTKQGDNTNESADRTNVSARSSSVSDRGVLIRRESYITLRTRRVHRSTSNRHYNNKSKSGLLESHYISDKDTTTQTDATLKCDNISPDLFDSYNYSLSPLTSSKDSRTIFSSESNKRLRNSRFKQSTNSSGVGAYYCDENTPIKITKRSRRYTPKKNYKIVDSIRKTSTPKFILIESDNSSNSTFLNQRTPLKDASNVIADSISVSSKYVTDLTANTPMKFTPNKNYKIIDFIRKTSTPKFTMTQNLNSTRTPLNCTSNITDDDKTRDSITDATDISENAPIKLTDCNDLLCTPKKDYKVIDEHRITTPKVITMESNESKEIVFAVPKLPVPKKRQDSVQEDKIVLKPGKLWRRSLLEVRNSKSAASPVRQSLLCVADKGCSACTCVQCKQNFIEEISSKRLSIRVVPLSDINRKESTILEDYAVSCRQSYLQHQSSLNDSLQNSTLCKDDSIIFIEQEAQIVRPISITAREIVLGKCEQDEPLPFMKLYPSSMLQNCQKIGEGVYGEVFLVRRPTSNDTSVMKIIPIEGSLTVNGERQKTFQEILSEITIAMELSRLRTNTKNRTDCFNELKKVVCVQGKYPKRLVELWELYDENRGSENDHPKMFNKDQLYIVLELANGGNDMENFVFENAQQTYSIIMQITLALAVAESEIEFEHRDLHWGNVLISGTNKNEISFSLNGKDISLKSYGVHVAIIDYTLSRISQDNVCLYNDLAMDPDLFTATGDYQFEVYRLMQKQNSNNWQHFEPYTNILWLHYLLEKAISSVRYRRKITKLHRQYLGDLKELYKDVLHYDSARMFAVDKFVD